MNIIVNRIGYWSGVAAFVSNSAFCIIQLLQIAGVFVFPLDEILIYSTSLGIVLPFILSILSLHYSVPGDKKFWTHGALCFSLLYAVFVTSNYVVQLATVIPMKLEGSYASIEVLAQTPHSMYWDYDALGYIFMGLATLFAVPVFTGQGIEKKVRVFFLLNGLITPVITFVYFYPHFSNGLLLLGFPWIITSNGSMLLLGLWFRRRMLAGSPTSI